MTDDPILSQEFRDGMNEIATYGLPKFQCPTHGVTNQVFSSSIKDFEGHWCLKCIIEKLEALGIHRLEPIERR